MGPEVTDAGGREERVAGGVGGDVGVGVAVETALTRPVQARDPQLAIRPLRGEGVHVELWTFEEGKSWDAGNLLGPCIDTDGLVDLTGEVIAPGELFASGEGDFSIRDNDFFQGGPRTNIWGETLSAEVSGSDGDYSYTFVGKNQARGGEYVKGAARFHLRAL